MGWKRVGYDLVIEQQQIYCDNHFMMYKSQIITLYTLNLHSAVDQLYLNKAGRNIQKKETAKSLAFQ